MDFYATPDRTRVVILPAAPVRRNSVPQSVDRLSERATGIYVAFPISSCQGRHVAHCIPGVVSRMRIGRMCRQITVVEYLRLIHYYLRYRIHMSVEIFADGQTIYPGG